ncbi:MAG TPA: carboxypeptidase regulatory-like domain-containing protein [Candidatus Sulfotelmatobacter sp.]|jgi:hypothetical protein|nr:carboxypeptidase regulatory-like domain-containing protein [Candidatus Sulfotelmatobacter sp.]
MRPKSGLNHLFLWVALVALFAGTSLVLAPVATAQIGISSGTIQGTILDPKGATVPSAKVTIRSKATGAAFTADVTSAGSYTSGPLAPGDYLVRVEASGFKTVELPVTVLTGTASSGNLTLEIGAGSTVVEVAATTIAVNADQATIQGVITQDQIENLPINGRNFLDLAQLEPGVQIQDGGDFDPTKKGFSSISFGGRFGRTARIEVDGLDISDETVGTTTQNVPVNSIQEFQVSQSNLDLATELTSSGTVNITTKSGSNVVHGDGFFNYRSDGTSAAIGNPPASFNRKQYGVDLGGPIFKDKLFAFGSWERTTQDLLASVTPTAPLDINTGSFNAPFHDQQYLGRLDYNITHSIRAFFKFGYEQNIDTASFIPNTFSPFSNVDNTPTYAGGVDFNTGSWTHSFRVGYLKFRNGIVDAVNGSGIYDPVPQLTYVIGNVSTACTLSGNLFCSGPNILAPQKTFQSNKQFKYDGSKTWGKHSIRYGIGVNRILGGGFANFFGIAPAVRAAVNANTEAFAAASPVAPGGTSNPLNWPVHRIDVGNGEGCFTEIPEFGAPCGGQFDTRFQWYLGDNWKMKSNLTVSYGIRYNRDTGRSDSDLPAVPALNAFEPGLGNPVHQPNNNYGGSIGVAWDPWKNGKTVIRAGAGIYYENGVFNNVLFDRPGRLPTGLFNQVQEACTQGGITLPGGTVVTTIDGLSIPNQICGDQAAVGATLTGTSGPVPVATAIADLQKQYQAATAAAGPQANGAYFGNALTTANTGSMFDPNYRSPYSAQMNVGFQRELHPGTVLSVDYVRNVGLHTLLGIDHNHTGDARFLDVPTATNAIIQTNQFLGCGASASAAAINCAIGKGATIGDYSNDTSVSIGGGLNATGAFPVGPGAVAFAGKNPNFGQVLMLEPVGRTVYNALDVVLRSDIKSPVKGIRHLNTQVSYALSRLNSQAQDVDFINNALDFNNPSQFIGPGSLDRTNQFSAGVVMELPAGIRLNFITHFYTALPQTLTFNAAGNTEDIFQYDTTGDGQVGIAPVPGSNVGSFGRDIKADGLNNFLQTYSTKYGNQLTPAGQALVSAGLFTSTQLQQLCAITPSLNPINNCASAYPGLQIQPAPAGQLGNSNFFTFDLRLGWSIKPIRKWERLAIEPQVAFYNLFNHSNFNGPSQLLSGVLDGTSGSVNGTTFANRSTNLQTGLGSGVFAIGAPRSIEFGAKVSF